MTDVVTITVDETVTDEERAAIRRALLEDAVRVMERLGQGIGGYAASRVDALTLKMARDMFPDLKLTMAVWAALGAGMIHAGTRRPAGWETTVAAWKAAVLGDPLPVDESPSQPPLPDMPSPPPVKEEEEEEEVERTCECDECTDRECQGDCDRCDDSGCTQCHGDCRDRGHDDCDTCYGDHEVCQDCGHCEDCDDHLDGDWYPGPCDQGHCHRCEHEC